MYKLPKSDFFTNSELSTSTQLAKKKTFFIKLFFCRILPARHLNEKTKQIRINKVCENFLSLSMEILKIEKLKPKALQFIKRPKECKLIKVDIEPVSALKAYIKKMRHRSFTASSLGDFTKTIEDLRAERYAKKLIA